MNGGLCKHNSQIATAMGFLLQITMSCLCALSRQGAHSGCGARAGCCELAVRVVETGCRCWVLVLGVLFFFHCKQGSFGCFGAAANAGCNPEKYFACFCYLGSMLV